MNTTRFKNKVNDLFNTYSAVEISPKTISDKSSTYNPFLTNPISYYPKSSYYSEPEQILEEEEEVEEFPLPETPPVSQRVIESAMDTQAIFGDTTLRDLTYIPIEEIFQEAGLTTVNGKDLYFGDKNLRTSNIGSKNSHHRVMDEKTHTASARDISIKGGKKEDYEAFKNLLLSNQLICDYMHLKNWGIINECSDLVRKHTGGTGPHFHFGPDKWAVRIWKQWLNNPNISAYQFIS